MLSKFVEILVPREPKLIFKTATEQIDLRNSLFLRSGANILCVENILFPLRFDTGLKVNLHKKEAI